MNYLATEDLQKCLKLNLKQAKALMRTEGFPSVKVGRKYIVEENDVHQWLSERKEVKLDYTRC